MNHPHDPSTTPRRNFLVKLGAAVAGALVALIPLASGLVAFFDPLRRKRAATKMIRLALLDDLPADGSPKDCPVFADRDDAWNRLANEPVGRVFLRRLPDASADKPNLVAFTAECPHAGCFVSFRGPSGPDDPGRYFCPCHNSAFRLDGSIIQKSPSPRDMDPLEWEVRTNDLGQQEVWVRFEKFRAGIEERKPLS
jgi:menaquinol-cytochrome c reductase iron-sulfur subunit